MLTLNDGRSELWQWDTGRTLAVDADCSQVHFSNKVFGRSIDVDVVDGVAIIPDILLQTDKDLNAWAFVGTAENGYTKISKTFKVNRRNKPADYVFTPVEQTTIAEIAAIAQSVRDDADAGRFDGAQGPAGPAGPVGPKGEQGDKGDPGPAGSDGKSAYAYAVEGGYTGTEAEFSARMAAEIPTVDSTLAQSGQAADAAVVGNRISALSEEIVTTSESKVAAHNTGTDTHSDIRLLIQGLTDRLNALADSDDTTLDQLSEVVAYIKSNRDLISSITTSKVSVADIVNNLTTNVTNKPLSAAQGVAIKTLIDALRNSTYSKPSSGIPKTDLASDVQDSLTKVDNMAANVKDYGAIGDGVADDTVAFQTALASNRCVYVSGGTYKLSGALVIRDACSMELSTDAVLDFTMTSGNCVSMKMSACLRGNHAVLRVPYAFAGNVINIASSLDSSVTSVPPYTKWDPQWKTGRYVTDVCITKPDSRGFHYSVDGTCSGTAIYIEADSGATSTFIWGLSASGIRIAGAFAYGIHAKMVGTGWCHEARIEAFIDACEIGVCMEDCNNAYVAATIQPRPALTTAGANVAYAKYGIYLIRSRNTDLSGSRVWDWNSNNSLWTGDTDSGCIYQHIAMIGNCAGTILNDFLYYEMPSYDIRKIIYTDMASNLEKINILQEPFTRWFKPISGAPMFCTGAENKELLLKEAYDATFQTTLVPQFTNLLPQATDISGAAFGTNGYKVGKMWGTDGVTLYDGSGILCSGLIPCSGGSVVRMKGISFSSGDDNCRVILYKADKTKLTHVNRNNLIANGSSYFINNYSAGENGCQFQIVENSAAYFAFNVYSSTSDGNPTVTVDEELNYSQVGTLASGIKVDYGQLINAPAVGVTQAWVESQGYLTLASLPKYDGGVS